MVSVVGNKIGNITGEGYRTVSLTTDLLDMQKSDKDCTKFRLEMIDQQKKKGKFNVNNIVCLIGGMHRAAEKSNCNPSGTLGTRA